MEIELVVKRILTDTYHDGKRVVKKNVFCCQSENEESPIKFSLNIEIPEEFLRLTKDNYNLGIGHKITINLVNGSMTKILKTSNLVETPEASS